MTGIPAFFIGTTALSTYSRALSVVSNNIANVNTAGFKRSQVQFEDLLADFRFDNIFGTGRGVNIAKVVNEFSQGSFENTQTDTDLAIAGNGFFMVKKTTGGDGTFYTRAGQFRFDKSGYLLDTNGYRLQGYGVNATTNKSTGVAKDIQIDKWQLAPKATTEVKAGVNLDSTAEVKGFNVVSGENDRVQLMVGYPSDVYKTLTATINPGVYTGATLATTLEAALESAGQSSGIVHDFSVTYDNELGRFSVKLNSTDANLYSFSVTPGINNMVSIGIGSTTTGAITSSVTLSLNPGGSTSSYTASSLATHIEQRLEAQVGGAWSVTFSGSTGKFSLKLDSYGAGTTFVRMGFTAPRTTAENILGFSSNASFNVGTTNSSSTAPFNGIDIQTYRTRIESSLNSGLVLRQGTTNTRVNIAAGTYTPNELAAALQTAIRGSGLTGANQFQVTYDEGARDFVFRNANGSGGSIVLDWNYNTTAGAGSILKTDEMVPALFGFTRTSADLSMAAGSVARSSTNGTLAVGRAFEFARMIGFVTDTAGGPRPMSLAAGSTVNQIADDLDPGEVRVSDEVAGRFDPRDAANTANFSTSFVAYDSLGNNRVVELHFRKDSKEVVTDSYTGRTLEVRRWEWFAGVDQSDVSRFTVNDTNNTLLFSIEGADSGESFASGDTFQKVDLTTGVYTGSELAAHLQSKLTEANSAASVTVTYSSTTGKFTLTNTSTTRPIAFDFDGVNADSTGNRTDAGFADLFGFDTTDSNDNNGLGNASVLLAAPTSGVTPNASNSLISRYAVGTGLEIEAAGILKFSDEGKLFDATNPENPETTSVGESKYGFLDGLFSDYTDFDFDSGSKPDQSIKFSFGTTTQSGGSGVDLSSQYNAEAIVNSMAQDGYAPGTLLRVAVARDGTVNGLYTNGQTFGIARVAIANFVNMTGLGTLGNNLWAETFESGPPVVNDPGTGVAGTIQSRALELANVDLATEFVQLLRNQRGFQANTRVITTTDGLLQDVLSLVR
ncbi:MAG: flagellar hook-basal body complex protein [Nitrospirae bacterium]|nr:flagellar hook-basal body complex protein [Nitrospirota bacterium]